MPGTFKVRVLIAIVALAALGLAAQSAGGRSFIDPALQYTFATDYSDRIADSLNAWSPLALTPERTGVPAAASGLMRCPCDIVAIERHFGWQWNADGDKREMFPGIFLQTEPDSEVYPLLPGTVTGVADGDGLRQLELAHDDGLVSIYAGLEEITVTAGQELAGDECIGLNGQHLYFELRNHDQPVDPEGIFQL